MTSQIWTHTTPPVGFDVARCKYTFEGRASRVLGDHDSPVGFEPDPSYADGRYKDITVRTAWMMYLDHSMEVFSRLGFQL